MHHLAISQRDRLLLLVLSEAVGGQVDKWVPRRILESAIRAAEEKLPRDAKVYFVHSSSQPAHCPEFEADLGLLETLGFISSRNGSLRLTSLGDSSCVRYNLPAAWQKILPLIQDQLATK